MSCHLIQTMLPIVASQAALQYNHVHCINMDGVKYVYINWHKACVSDIGLIKTLSSQAQYQYYGINNQVLLIIWFD